LWEFLALDFSSNLNPQDDVHERDLLIKHYGLSDEEELVLVCVLSCAVSLSGPESKPDLHSKISQEVVKHLPKLLAKYSKEFSVGSGMTRLIEVLSIVPKIKLSIYVDMRMIKVFTDCIYSRRTSRSL
jgi:hypothetical protein